MAKIPAPEAVEERPHTIQLYEKEVKGISDLTVDGKKTISLNVKITEVGRNTYEKNKPLRAEMEILSGKILDTKVKEDIKGAKNLKELEKAAESVPKED